MYLPKHFAQHDAAALHGLLRDHPLAVLVSGSADVDSLTADHVPLHYVASEGTDQGLRERASDSAAEATSGAKHGTLIGHVARANPLWREASGKPVLAIFRGPQAYITPSAYPSKASTHKVVPTWNYTVVHAHGVLEAVDDAPWLHTLVSALTHTHESARAAPWAVTDAPDDFVQQLLGAIVGIRITLTRPLLGKWKISQNRSDADRSGVAAELAARAPGGAASDDAHAMARLVAPGTAAPPVSASNP